jgi:hypothetical protein
MNFITKEDQDIHDLIQKEHDQKWKKQENTDKSEVSPNFEEINI